jgi:hypothetical protein
MGYLDPHASSFSAGEDDGKRAATYYREDSVTEMGRSGTPTAQSLVRDRPLLKPGVRRVPSGDRSVTERPLRSPPLSSKIYMASLGSDTD